MRRKKARTSVLICTVGTGDARGRVWPGSIWKGGSHRTRWSSLLLRMMRIKRCRRRRRRSRSGQMLNRRRRGRVERVRHWCSCWRWVGTWRSGQIAACWLTCQWGLRTVRAANEAGMQGTLHGIVSIGSRQHGRTNLRGRTWLNVGNKGPRLTIDELDAEIPDERASDLEKRLLALAEWRNDLRGGSRFRHLARRFWWISH